MSLFERVSARDHAALGARLAADPAAATTRNAEGASLLAFAGYVGDTEATAMIRAALPAIDPYEAIIIGETDRFEQALAEGWDGNALSPDGFTPLALASFFGRDTMFSRLLPLARDVNQRSANAQQVAALHAAAARRSPTMVERLLRAGADPDLPQQRGFVALHTAASNGDAAMAALLLLFGATADRRDTSGKAAADHARDNGHGWLADRLAAWPVAPLAG